MCPKILNIWEIDHSSVYSHIISKCVEDETSVLNASQQMTCKVELTWPNIRSVKLVPNSWLI